MEREQIQLKDRMYEKSVERENSLEFIKEREFLRREILRIHYRERIFGRENILSPEENSIEFIAERKFFGERTYSL